MSASLTFLTPPLGLEPLVDFVLDAIDGAEGLYALRAAEAGGSDTGTGTGTGVRLYVLDPAVHLPEYLPELSGEARTAIGIDADGDPSVLVVVTPASEATTVNLMAPIIVNPETGLCQQLILADQGWPLRAPLMANA